MGIAGHGSASSSILARALFPGPTLTFPALSREAQWGTWELCKEGFSLAFWWFAPYPGGSSTMEGLHVERQFMGRGVTWREDTWRGTM